MSSSPQALAGNTALAAISFMVVGGFLNTIMLSLIKELAGELHAFEIAFFRCLVGFIVLLPLVWRNGGLAVLQTRQPGLHIFRGVLNAGGMLLFFWAVALSPLATVSAIGFASPLFAAMLAIVILRENVGIRRWSGLIAGFAGTLIILRPGAGVIEFGAAIALASSLLWAGAMITIKKLTQTESPLSITTWASATVGLFCLVPALFVWQWPTAWQWFLLVIIGALGSLIQYCLAKAFSLAQTTVVLPFDFLKLVWASLFGYFLFAEVPDPWAWAGGTVIFASAVYVAYREHVVSREAAASVPVGRTPTL